MARRDEEAFEQRHKGEVEKEQLDELEDELDDYDDLIGGGPDNSQAGAVAAAVRAQRSQRNDLDSADAEELFQVIDERELFGAPAPPAGGHLHSTADEPEDSGSPLAAPPDDGDDSSLLPAMGGDSWAPAADERLAAPAATEPTVASSGWLKDDD